LAAFFTGVLAVVVAAPCTAPFMATAVGVALSQGGWVNGAIFLSLGVGFAAPVVLLTYFISYSPALAAKMPRPGVWMDRLKLALSVPMFLAALWLWWVFSQQIGAFGPLLLAVGMMVIIVALLPISKKGWLKAAGLGLGVLMAVAAASMAPAPKGKVAATAVPSVAFDAAALEDYRAQDRAVLVDMTAAWCVTCKVNERLLLSSSDFARVLADTDTVYMVGDWTNADPAITAYLAHFGRSGVPLYVYYPRGHRTPVILPQLLDKKKVYEILKSN
jgi:thiol:disulfide interchange protein DsbD